MPGDGADDTAPSQRAIDAASKQGGGTVLFPPGRYDISIGQSALGSGQGKIGLRIHAKLRLAARYPGQATTLRVGDGRGNYARMLGTFGEPLEDFELRGLTIDGNGGANPVQRSTASGEQNAADFDNGNERYALAFYGHRVRVAGARFTNQSNVNVITVWGDTTTSSDVEIVDSTFDDIGGGAANYDDSTVRSTGQRVRVAGNSFRSGNGPGTRGAVTAIEIHDTDQLVEGNGVDGYIVGANVVGDGSTNGRQPIPASRRQLYRDNHFRNTKAGFYLWSDLEGQPAGTTMLQDVQLLHNRFGAAGTPLPRRGPQLGNSEEAGYTASMRIRHRRQRLPKADDRTVTDTPSTRSARWSGPGPTKKVTSHPTSRRVASGFHTVHDNAMAPGSPTAFHPTPSENRLVCGKTPASSDPRQSALRRKGAPANRIGGLMCDLGQVLDCENMVLSIALIPQGGRAVISAVRIPVLKSHPFDPRNEIPQVLESSPWPNRQTVLHSLTRPAAHSSSTLPAPVRPAPARATLGPSDQRRDPLSAISDSREPSLGMGHGLRPGSEDRSTHVRPARRHTVSTLTDVQLGAERKGWS